VRGTATATTLRENIVHDLSLGHFVNSFSELRIQPNVGIVVRTNCELLHHVISSISPCLVVFRSPERFVFKYLQLELFP
jgi:hypothetical protein